MQSEWRHQEICCERAPTSSNRGNGPLQRFCLCALPEGLVFCVERLLQLTLRNITEPSMILNIKQHISSSSSICTTAYIWPTDHRSFISITTHWMKKKKLQREFWAIACRRMKGRHKNGRRTFDKIGEMISEIHDEFVDYGQCPKTVCTITDNAINFVKSFKMFGCCGECTWKVPVCSTRTLQSRRTRVLSSVVVLIMKAMMFSCPSPMLVKS